MTLRKTLFPWLLAATVLNAGCSGDDLPVFDQQQKTATGQFLDSAVANLDYRTPTLSGETDSRGQFGYLEGESVTFAIGNVTLGTAPGQPTITPMSLVPNGSSATPAVQNISRLLLALDEDGDAGNGITLSAGIKSAAQQWPPVDFFSEEFDNAVAAILAEAGSIDGRSAALPAATKAKEHLEKSFYCAYSGGYSGTFTGPSRQGQWTFVVDDEGNIAGVGNSAGDTPFSLSGKLNADAAGTFTSKLSADTAMQPAPEWSGELSPSGTITGSGTFGSTEENINLTGSRKTVPLPAGTGGDIYRGTLQLGAETAGGDFELTGVGVMSIAINNNKLSGKVYLFSEDRVFDIPADTALLEGNGFTFETAGKLFIGRLQGDSIIMGLNDLLTTNIAGGGTACKTP